MLCKSVKSRTYKQFKLTVDTAPYTRIPNRLPVPYYVRSCVCKKYMNIKEITE